MHLSTDGRVFYSGSGRGSRFFNPATMTWTSVVATMNHGSTRTYGTSVLLPLMPANGYRPRVMIFGGSNPATATTEIIDLGAPSPQWQFGPSMSQARIQMNATILPNGRVFAVGGSVNDEHAATASRTPTSTTRPPIRSVRQAPTSIRACTIPGRCSFRTRPSCWWAEIRHVAHTSSTSRSTPQPICSTPMARPPRGRRSTA